MEYLLLDLLLKFFGSVNTKFVLNILDKNLPAVSAINLDISVTHAKQKSASIVKQTAMNLQTVWFLRSAVYVKKWVIWPLVVGIHRSPLPPTAPKPTKHQMYLLIQMMTPSEEDLPLAAALQKSNSSTSLPTAPVNQPISSDQSTAYCSILPHWFKCFSYSTRVRAWNLHQPWEIYGKFQRHPN